MNARLLLAVPLAVVFLAGCNSGSGQQAITQRTPTSTPSATASVTPSPSPRPLTADQVGRQLARRLPITVTVVYNARTDPNHLLGRPNGYLSKIAFADHRVKSSDAQGWSKGDVELGGSVEVFANDDRAAARADYIQRLQSGSSLYGNEYDYLAGPILVRVTGYLTPAQAGSYKRALAAFTAVTVQGPA